VDTLDSEFRVNHASMVRSSIAAATRMRMHSQILRADRSDEAFRKVAGNL
jgi:hypothetical protein